MAMLTRADRRASLPICSVRQGFFFFNILGACVFPRTRAAASSDQRIAGTTEQRPERRQRLQEDQQVPAAGPSVNLFRAAPYGSSRSREHPTLPTSGSDLIGEKHRDEQFRAVVAVPGTVPPSLFGKATSSQECHQPPRGRSVWGENETSPRTSPTTTHSACRPSARLRHWMATCGKVVFVSAFLCQAALLRGFTENAAKEGLRKGVNQKSPPPAVGASSLVASTTAQAGRSPFLPTATTTARPPGVGAPSREQVAEEATGMMIEQDHRRRMSMFANDEIGLLRLLSMRRLTALAWVLDKNENSPDLHILLRITIDRISSWSMMGEEWDRESGSALQFCCEELFLLEQACIVDVLLGGRDVAPRRASSSVMDDGSTVPPAAVLRSFLRRRPDADEGDNEKDAEVELEALASSLSKLQLEQQQGDTFAPSASSAAWEMSSQTETNRGRRLGPSGGGGSRSLGNNVSAGTCPERVLLELASRRCEVHRSEAQGLKWSGSLHAISEDVARDLQTWSTHQRLNLSDSVAGSSRGLGVPQQRQRFSETVASIHELDQVLAKLRVVRLQEMGGDQGLAVVAADSLPLFWSALPFLARCALLRASTVCGICSLLYVLNLHKLTIYVVRSLRDSASGATASRKESQAEPRDEDHVLNELPGHGQGQDEEQHELDEQHRGAAGFVQEEADIGPDALSDFFEKVGEEAAGAKVAPPSLAGALHRGTGENKVDSPPSPRSPPPTRQAQAASSSSGPSALSSDEAAVAQEAAARSQESGRASSKESGARVGDAADGGSCRAPSRTSTSSFFRQIPTSTSETGRNGYQGTESRALFQGEWQLQRLENFGEEYYPESNLELHNLRLHMSGLQIFGDLLEDLWGGEPYELSFVHLRTLERRLLKSERIALLLAAAEDAAPDRAFLPPCSAVEFDEVSSCGGCSWAANELLSECDEVCSSTTSAVCAAERLGRAEEQEAPPSRASSPSIEQDLEMQINNGDDWLAARDDHLHDQRRKLKKEMVEPLVAFLDGEATNFLRGLKTSKGIYVMHLEKRSSTGLDGCSGRSKGSATAAGEGAQEDESRTPKDDELDLVMTRIPPGFGIAEVIEALTHAAGREGGAEGEADADGSGTGLVRPSTLPREVYRRATGARFVPLLQRRK